MAELLILIALVAFFVGVFLIKRKIDQLKYRARESVYNKVGLGDSQITSVTDEMVEKGKMKKFLENHPTYTEESIKELLKSFATEIVNKNLTHSAEQKVIDKLANDNKISKYADMDIVRCNIHGYNEKAGLFMAKVTLTNGRDQYMMFLQFNLVGDELTLVKYQVQRGDVVGF
ncbi:MAG: hypothetical protein U0O04_07065 [Clostridia bacterium]|jgi:polyhydroxyalkanoate synthesis regulator phasin|nr:unknown [Clostridium sp. CAG:571]HJJ06797.1 hypothetical protein [Clostridiaceae bacterium]